MDTEIERVEHDRAQHKQIEDLKIIELGVVFACCFPCLMLFWSFLSLIRSLDWVTEVRRGRGMVRPVRDKADSQVAK